MWFSVVELGPKIDPGSRQERFLYVQQFKLVTYSFVGFFVLFCFVFVFLPLDVFKWKSTDILLDHQKVKVAQSLFETLRTIQSMEFSRLEYWSGQPFPSPGGLPNPQIEPSSPALQADSLPTETPGKPQKSGLSSLSFLQQIFPTQELNWCLCSCRIADRFFTS